MKKLSLGLIFLFFITAVFANNKIIAKNGVLDLQDWDWKKDGSVTLTGNWEFCWRKFYTPDFFESSSYKKEYSFVPSYWNNYLPHQEFLQPAFGYATYHLVVLCPSSTEQLALKFLTVESAYRLFVNGKQVIVVGNPGTTVQTTIAELRPVIVDVNPENNKLDIVIQVSNFHNYRGGLWDFVKLGAVHDLQTDLIKNISIELFVAGAFLVAGVYYLILFFNFRMNKVLLLFSMLCFIVCVRNLAIEEMPMLYFSDGNWELTRRAEYISFYLSVPVMSLFSYFLFPQEFSKIVLNIILITCLIFVVISLIGSYYLYTFPVRYYQIIMLLTTFYGLYVYVNAAIKRRSGSLIFLIGFCVFLLTIINDLLNVNFIVNTIPMFYIGLAFFGISLFILLSRQFVQIFYDLQKLNGEISVANEGLAKMNNEIMNKNEALNKINYELDSFVNRTSHDLKAPLISVLGIIRKAKKETDVNLLQEYFSIQEKTLNRMNNLIDDIVEFSKNKRLKLDLKEIDFKELTSHALEDHAYMFNAKNIRKRVEINQYEKFVSDPRRISVIINNLISNAIKYADFTKIEPEIQIRITVADSSANIEVIDNGVGIEEKNLDNIFTLFYNVTNSITGSGLGLYIVKETTEKLNGYITINSKKGDGTAIKITIPDIGHNLY